MFPPMPHQYSMLAIMNAALVSTGWDEITSENDGTAEFRTMMRNWHMIVEAELEAGNYEFTRGEATLVSRVPGKFGKDDGFLIPAEALTVRHLWVPGTSGDREYIDWSSDGVAVYVDSPTGCTIEYLTVPDPSIWSANFSLGVQYRLQALLLRAHAGEAGEANTAEMMAEQAFQTARTLASKGRSPRPLVRRSAFADARFARGAV